ncbi:uncharacterized protein LOC114284521 [Camellia sinensis]|uniref:uncharacterized protein LOC114284521 n=1 Tax=Camellia sinensis TaxID=4442 RepID=UPI001035E15C|nr:uncharacterized protein LOC114284521 [Camellia sinensis]
MIYNILNLNNINSVQVHLTKGSTLSRSESKPQPKRQRGAPTNEISFSDNDHARFTFPHSDALVIDLRVNRYSIEQILINQGSNYEIMYYKTFLKLGLKDGDLKPADYPLFDFNANLEYPLGNIVLPIRASTKTLDVKFLVVKLSSSYNIIMGRMRLHTMKVVLSTNHQLLQFPTEHDIEQIRDLKNQ